METKGFKKLEEMKSNGIKPTFEEVLEAGNTEFMDLFKKMGVDFKLENPINSTEGSKEVFEKLNSLLEEHKLEKKMRNN